MNDFPKIKNNQVVISRAEKLTGLVLDENFNRYSSNNEKNKKYTLFENFDLAKEYIDENIKLHNNTEYYIYGKNETLLYCSNDTIELIRQGKIKLMIDEKIKD
jgi:hypothetical protein